MPGVMWVKSSFRATVFIAIIASVSTVHSKEISREIVPKLEKILQEQLSAAISDPQHANLPYKIEMNFVYPGKSNNYYSYEELELYLYWVYIMVNEFNHYAHTNALVQRNLAETFERNRKEFVGFLSNYRLLLPDICNAIKDSILLRAVTGGAKDPNLVFAWELDDFIKDHNSYIYSQLGAQDGGKCLAPIVKELNRLQDVAASK